MVDGFIIAFKFEDNCSHIDTNLNIVKKKMFENEAPVIWKPYWVAHIQNVMEFYNLTAEEYEDSRNIDIKDLEGHRELNGPEIEMPDIMNPLKMRK